MTGSSLPGHSKSAATAKTTASRSGAKMSGTCRTCDYCGGVVMNYVRKRCPTCRLLICGGCWDAELKCCVACVTLADRKLAVVKELDD